MSNSQCLEVAYQGDIVWLRSSRDPDRTIELTKAEWEPFKEKFAA